MNTEKQPLISVIIPTYKTESYIDRCLKSVVNQTYTNLEIILVDPNSPDSTSEKCREWAKHDKRIKVLTKEDRGLSDDRNAGIDVSTGEVITFLDGDDYIDLNMYEEMIKFMYVEDIDVVTCGRFLEYNKERIELHNAEKRVCSGIEAIKEILECGIINEAAWDKIYKKEVFKNRRFPIGEINEDLLLMIDIFGIANRVGHVGRSFYHYCVNEGSLTHSPYTEKKEIYLRHIYELNTIIETKYSELTKSARVITCDYALGALMSIYNTNNGVYKFKSSLDEYYKLLRKTWVTYFRCDNIPNAKKAKCLLMITKLYQPLRSAKKMLRK